jgi:hypothetical protein
MPAMRNVALATVLIALLTGCSFDRKWRAAKRAEAAFVPTTLAVTPPTDPLAGRWQGKWVSKSNGHSGGLRAIITRVDDHTYRADFDASYMAILRFGYGMQLNAKRDPDGEIAFEGNENLGSLAGGEYQYNGTADGTTFDATYKSSADHGTFQMTRPTK